MSSKDLARRADVQITFAGTDISADILPYLLSITYTDNEEDEADDLQITMQDRDDVWLQGWLQDAVEASSSTTTTVQTAAASTGRKYRVTATSGLNVRSGPGTGYSKRGALCYGAEVTVTGTSGGWSVIQYNGQTSYISSEYIAAVDGGGQETETQRIPGMQIQAVIAARNMAGDGKDRALDCGQFELDSVNASGPPQTITIKATALPYSATIRNTLKSRAWESYNLRDIAKEIADKNGMSCMYLSESNPRFDRLEQYRESDIGFLSRLCHANGVSLKSTSNILVLFDQAAYERKDAVYEIRHRETGYSRYKLSVGKADTQYTSCRVSYVDPTTGRCIEGVARVDDYDENSKNNQQLEISAKVTNISEAIRLAEKMLRYRNKYAQTASFTLPGDPLLVSGKTVTLSKWGYFDGKYIITEAKHSVSRSNGYTVQIEMRKVLVGDLEPEQTAAKTYKVGDTVQFLGGYHYVSSSAANHSGYCKPGPARLTIIAAGAKHPYHLIHTDGQSWVYGWVDEGSFT